MTTIPSMRSLNRALAFLLLAAAALPAAAVTVDDFTTNQATIGDPPGGASSVATGGADIVGLHRDLVVDILSGAGPVSAGVTGGTLSVTVTDTTPDSRGQAIVTWDGDTDPNALDATGLSPLDLTASGHSAFAVTVTSAGAGSEIVFEVYTDAANMSRAALRLPAVGASSVFHLSFAQDFVTVLGSGADFADVGAIVMTVRGTETTVDIDKVETEAPGLAVTKVDLTTSDVPIGATPQSPGTTIRYRVTITNTGGEAKGVTLADVVDANTTLAAATVDATPVAVDDAYDTFGNVPLSVPAGTGLLSNDADPDTVGAPPELVVTTTGMIATALGGTATVAADGSFEYDPPVGAHKSVDTFSYTVKDNETPANNASATAKIHIGRRIWFVDDAHPGADLGTRNDPFVGLDAANLAGAGGAGDQDEPGDVLYFYAGTHPTTGLKLEDGQEVFGEGVALVVDGQTVLAAGTPPTLTHAGGDVLTLGSGNSIRGLNLGNAAAGGFRIAGSGFGTLVVSNVSISGTGGALSLTNGTAAVALSGITAASPSVRGVLLDNVGGTLSVSGSTTVTSSVDDSIRIANAPASASYSFGTTSLSTNGAANGLELQSNAASATTTVSSLAITTNNGTGLFASSGGTLSVGGASNTISSTGPAVDVTSTSFGAGATFSTVSSSSSGGKGIHLDTVSGSFVAGGGSITGSAGVAFDVNAGSSTITYAGSITNGADRCVEVTGRTGGTVTVSGNINDTGTGIHVANNNAGGTPIINLSGASKVINTGANPAITLDNNDVATVNLTGGGLAVTTTSGIGFNAINGAAGISVQGSGNTITSTTGTALNVVSTAIAAAGMTFQSISANGAANGIVLNGTGASGGLTVTGVGMTAGSGGTIQNVSGRGASFINAVNVSLANMNLTNTATSAGAPCGSAATVGGNTGCNAAIHLSSVTGVSLDRLSITTSGQQGINGINVTGLTLSNSTLAGLGNGADEDGLHFLDLLGTNSISNTNITSSGDDNVNIQLRSSTASTINVTGGSFNTGVLGSGLLFGARDSSNATVNISSVVTDNNFSGGIVADGFDTATLVLNVTGSTITNNNDGIQVSANNGTSQFDIDSNAFTGNDFLAVTLLKAAFSTGGTLEGAVRNNSPITIPNGKTTDAISIFQAGGGALKAAVTNNVFHYAGTQRVILVQAGQDGNGTLDTTITGNNIDIELDGAGNAVAGILAQSAITGPGNTAALCFDMGGAGALSNSFTHSLGGTIGAGDIRVRQRNDGTVRLPGYGGAATDTAAVVTYLSGRNTVVSTPTASFDSTGFGGGGACSSPTIP